MAYKDLDTFFDPDLHLPIKGNWYTVPAPGAEECFALRERVAQEGVPPNEQVEDALLILGAERDEETGKLELAGVVAEMVADNITWPMILHAGRTAQLHFGFSPDMAEAHWSLAQLGKLVDLERIAEMFLRPKPEKKAKPKTKTGKRGGR
ncbi:hypothetical protein C1M55_31635 (plasmid) [Rhodococcus qingshengii]|uniref:DUF7426 family protein n=1 Tax=Rhodococcus TaxID=1827 RepID=UPI0009787D00|nr:MULTISPECIES: hypothetical protein [Rhodococcus]AUS30102.1 hypothetical protein C1M55_02560 [Rhodococcus qingshengii]AUS35809.1 hypothetical protein C1M55_31635 [Rhodococcus qingshengii]OMQ31542.1 hypothetical protein BK799_20985 [Rhodococcus sp. D-1]